MTLGVGGAPAHCEAEGATDRSPHILETLTKPPHRLRFLDQAHTDDKTVSITSTSQATEQSQRKD